MNTALITGAGRGIGLATAHAFVPAGWRVLALDKQFGPEIAGERVEFDLRDPAAIPLLTKELGEVHTLVNNAAVLYCDPFDAIPEGHRREILAVNLEAPAALIAALAPQMRQRRSGRIVNVSSVSAFTGHPDLWYGRTKSAILNLTKSWAKAIGPYGVVVNAVAPGPTRTQCTNNSRSPARMTSCVRFTLAASANPRKLPPQSSGSAAHRPNTSMA